MGALIEIEIRVDRNTKKSYTVSISDAKTKAGRNVSVYLPQTDEEIQKGTPKEFVGGGNVFWTDGRILVSKDCPEYESK